MNPFTTALIKAPKRSRFDFSHSNTIGIRFGALTPTLSQFIIPGDEVSMSVEQIARLAPMPVPTFINMKVRHDFFFVPMRLIYPTEDLDILFGANAGGSERACTADLQVFYSLFSGYNFKSKTTPAVSQNGMPWGYCLPGSLFDYLGFPVLSDRNSGLTESTLTKIAENNVVGAMSDIANEVADSNGAQINSRMTETGKICIEKLFAYHFIWRDWYRFTGIDNDTIIEPYIANHPLRANNSWLNVNAGAAYTLANKIGADKCMESAAGTSLQYGNLGQLKYAHLTKDMFMSARYGNKPTVLIPTGDNGTIPALREASAIQRFIDILTITGQRYFDKVKGLFGIEPEGPKDDRVQFLARYQQFIKVGEVLTTASTEQAETGDYAGRGVLIDGKYLFKRRFTEHGYLFCITSIIPDIAYSGLHRDITDVNVFDTPIPTMAQVGDQTIKCREFNFMYSQLGSYGNNSSFGDQFRYYAYKSANNECHGFFLMETARPWSPLLPQKYTIDSGNQTESIKVPNNPIDASRVYPVGWNFVFNDTSDEFIFGDRFFFNIDFYEKITRALPKYINYHL